MSGTVQRAAPAVATERYEALLRVLQTLISICSAEELFRLLARELRAAANFNPLGVAIYDGHARTRSWGRLAHLGQDTLFSSCAAWRTQLWLVGRLEYRSRRPSRESKNPHTTCAPRLDHPSFSAPWLAASVTMLQSPLFPRYQDDRAASGTLPLPGGLRPYAGMPRREYTRGKGC